MKQEKDVNYFIYYIVNRLSLVKPERAQQIEDMIIQNGAMGAYKEKKQREDFEENVFNLIEDTCTKLATSNLDN